MIHYFFFCQNPSPPPPRLGGGTGVCQGPAWNAGGFHGGGGGPDHVEQPAGSVPYPSSRGKWTRRVWAPPTQDSLASG